MSYITSRSYPIDYEPTDYEYHMWRIKRWPYVEVDKNQILYFYETPNQRLVWRTRIVEVDRFEYNSKAEARHGLEKFFGYGRDSDSSYFHKAPKQGYCLAYKVKALRELDLPKPPSFKMPQFGWFRIDDLDERTVRKWFGTKRP